MPARIIFGLVLGLTIIGCSGGDGEEKASDSRSYLGTQAPGDVWKWQIDPDAETVTMHWDMGTFDDLTDDLTITGTYTRLPSGYLKVENLDSTPDHAEVPEDGTAWFYAVEIPNVALIVKPEGSIKGEIIALAAEGDCTSALGTFNYLHTANVAGFDPVVEDAFGTATFSGTPDAITLEGTKHSLDCLVDGPCTVSGSIQAPPTATCEGGHLILKEGETTVAEGQITPAGVMALDFGFGNGGIFGFAQSDISLGQITGRSYIGVVFTESDSFPGRVDFTGGAIGTASAFTSLENDTVDAAEAMSIEILAVADGHVTGNFIHGDESTTPFAGAAIVTDGVTLLTLLGTTSAEDGSPIVALLAQD
jgi:hypothetical protein